MAVLRGAFPSIPELLVLVMLLKYITAAFFYPLAVSVLLLLGPLLLMMMLIVTMFVSHQSKPPCIGQCQAQLLRASEASLGYYCCSHATCWDCNLYIALIPTSDVNDVLIIILIIHQYMEAPLHLEPKEWLLL